MSQTETRSARSLPGLSWLPTILIGVLTLGICHFAGLCLVTSAFNGVPRRSAMGGAVVCTTLVGLLVWRQTRQTRLEPVGQRKWILVMTMLWVITLAGLSLVQSRADDAVVAVMLVYPLASCGWIFTAYSAAFPGRVRTKSVAAFVLLALQLVFPLMFRFAGLTGAGQTMLTWRSRPDASASDAPQMIGYNALESQSKTEPQKREPDSERPGIGDAIDGTTKAVDAVKNGGQSDAAVESESGVERPTTANVAADGAKSPQIETIELHASPQFMGRHRTGQITTIPLDFNWEQNPPRKLWDRTIGAGWGSFTISGELCWTQEQRGEREFVVCYRLLTGDPVWAHSDAERFESSMGGPGPRGTPTLHGNSLVTLGGTGVLNCLDAKTGSSRWQRNVLKDNGGGSIAHGVCGSPLVMDDTVVVAVTGAGARSIAAYQLDTGEPVWSGGIHPASYSSPVVMEIDGVRQIVLFGEDGVASVEWGSGRDLWFFPWTSETRVNCAQPVVSPLDPHDMVIACAYGKGAVRFRVESIDSISNAGNWKTTELWRSRNLKTKFTSAVLYEEHLYGLDDGILVCVEWATGKRAWKAGHYNYGQVILVNDKLLVQTEEGPIAVVQPDPQRHREIATLPALDGRTWNYPAAAGRWLLLRNDQQAQCWELPTLSKTP